MDLIRVAQALEAGIRGDVLEGSIERQILARLADFFRQQSDQNRGDPYQGWEWNFLIDPDHGKCNGCGEPAGGAAYCNDCEAREVS